MILNIGSARAADYTFGDEFILWGRTISGPDTWLESDQWLSNNSTIDNNDIYGSPSLSGGGVTYSAGQITEVFFSYTEYDIGLLGTHYGDLFIDVGADSTWDYVIIGETRGSRVVGQHYALPSLPAKRGGIDPTTTTDYVLSQKAWSDSGNVRKNHPVWVSDTVLGSSIGTPATITNDTGNDKIVFSNLSIAGDFTKPFIIAWSNTCANDIIYETVPAIPEPNTMLLLGFGLVWLAGFRRKQQTG